MVEQGRRSGFEAGQEFAVQVLGYGVGVVGAAAERRGQQDESPAFGLGHVEPVGDAAQHPGRGDPVFAAFEGGVPAGADARESGDVVLAQARGAVAGAFVQVHLGGFDPGPAGGEQVVQVLAAYLVDVHDVFPPRVATRLGRVVRKSMCGILRRSRAPLAPRVTSCH
ncbi:hypothetical protein OG948_58555 (plasmid) [Embleya sp. NBC_00888]|nr:hypothetical protein OG948_58555 [Embleya sp. NBC_00888]